MKKILTWFTSLLFIISHNLNAQDNSKCFEFGTHDYVGGVYLENNRFITAISNGENCKVRFFDYNLKLIDVISNSNIDDIAIPIEFIEPLDNNDYLLISVSGNLYQLNELDRIISYKDSLVDGSGVTINSKRIGNLLYVIYSDNKGLHLFKIKLADLEVTEIDFYPNYKYCLPVINQGQFLSFIAADENYEPRLISYDESLIKLSDIALESNLNTIYNLFTDQNNNQFLVKNKEGNSQILRVNENKEIDLLFDFSQNVLTNNLNKLFIQILTKSKNGNYIALGTSASGGQFNQQLAHLFIFDMNFELISQNQFNAAFHTYNARWLKETEDNKLLIGHNNFNNTSSGGNGNICYYKNQFQTGSNTINLNEINVYPNPFSDKININLEEKSDLSIYSIDGKLLRQQNLGLNSELDFSDLNKGIYFLKISNFKSSKSVKIIKN